MTPPEPDYKLYPVEQIALRLTEGTWAFAEDNRAEIAEHWQGLVSANSTLFNGKLLLMVNGGLSDGVFQADLIEVDYASFITWRHWGWCDKSVHDCYGCAIIMSADGALVMGRMGNHTINAGMIYPPGGSLTREDLAPEGAVDMTASIARELYEETGLPAAEATSEGYYMAASDQRIAIGQVLRFNQSAADLVSRIERHMASETLPELSEVVVMRELGEMDPDVMPPYARAFSTVVLDTAAQAG